MKRVPANRYLVFFLIAGLGLFWDLFSKDMVFADLGYHDPDFPAIVLNKGKHQLFAHPPLIEGQSKPYLNGWLKFRLWTNFNRGCVVGNRPGEIVAVCFAEHRRGLRSALLAVCAGSGLG